MSDANDTYDGSHIQVLPVWQSIRKRPGMYVGSTSERGLHQMVFDVASRAINEVLPGRAGSVRITLTADGGVRVTDDGPGIPVKAAGDTGGPHLEDLLTDVYSGTLAVGRHTAFVSSFGVGPCVANALSSRLTAEVRREGVRWVQEYARGVALSPPTAVGPTTGSGTTIAFWPDPDIFGTAECSSAVLSERFAELGFLYQGLNISLTDERPSRGARDLVAFLDAREGLPGHPDVIGFEREVPRMAGTVEVALRWSGSGGGRVRGFVNGCPTHEGGTHELGFGDGLAAAVNAYARERGLLGPTGADLDPDRIGEGLTAVVSVKLDRPVLGGATRTRLENADVRARVAEVVQEQLGSRLDGNPEQADAIVRRILRAAGRD